MRAGRLKTKRYKVKNRRWGILAVLAAALAAFAFYYARSSGSLPLFHLTAPALSPEESARETKTLTLPGKTWYVLQLGAFETEDMALSLARTYQARGAAGFIDESDHFRVLAAAYDSRAAAQAVQTRLGALHGVEAYVTQISRPEIQIRVSGQTAQLTALSDAYDALNNAAEKAYSLSCGLDDQEMEGAEIRASLLSEKETASALRERLGVLFGENAPAAVSFIIQALDSLENALEKALDASGDTALGAQIKYTQLLCIERMAAYARMLQE